MSDLSAKVQEAFATKLQADLKASDKERLELKRQDFLHLGQTLSAEDAVEDLHACLVSAWLELRSEWNRLNQVVQYIVVHGEHDTPVEMMYRASAVAELMARVEACLAEREVEHLVSLAANPLGYRSVDETAAA